MRELIERHIKLTHSTHAKRLLANWEETVSRTWKATPAAKLALQRQQAEAEATAAD
jgi:glutamate synthase domain-containing protein 3